MKETEKDVKLIGRIVRRYRTMLRSYYIPEKDIPGQLRSIGRIRQIHEKENLNLEKLYAFPDPDFGHDVGGILKFAEPNGALPGDKFWPRCGARTKEESLRERVLHGDSVNGDDALKFVFGKARGESSRQSW